jgi:hypothetical protein
LLELQTPGKRYEAQGGAGSSQCDVVHSFAILQAATDVLACVMSIKSGFVTICELHHVR